MESSIELEDVSLIYPVYGVHSRSIKSVVSFATGGRLNREEAITFQVRGSLKNINIKFSSGDRVGIVGHNGAGKTTLLKVLAQIYETYEGTGFGFWEDTVSL